MAELGSDQGPPTRSWKELLTGFWFCILIIKLVQVCGFKKKKTPKDPQQQNKPNQSCRRGPEKGTSVTPAHRGAAPLPDLPDEDRPAQGGARPRSSHRLVPLCSPVLLSLVCVAWLVSSRHGPLLPPPARQLRGLRATRRGPAGRAPASAPKGAGSLALLQVWGSRLAAWPVVLLLPVFPSGQWEWVVLTRLRQGAGLGALWGVVMTVSAGLGGSGPGSPTSGRGASVCVFEAPLQAHCVLRVCGGGYGQERRWHGGRAGLLQPGPREGC